MPEQTKTRRATKTTVLHNPGPGTVLPITAGEQAAAEWDFVNDTPDVAAFSLRVEGLPDATWATGDIDMATVSAAASGGGSLRLTLMPPDDAAPGDYAFSVSIVSDESVIGAGKTPLTLRIAAAPKPIATQPASEPDAANTANGQSTDVPASRRRRTPRATKPAVVDAAETDFDERAPEVTQKDAQSAPLHPETLTRSQEPTPTARHEAPLPVVDFSPPDEPEEEDAEEDAPEMPEEPSVVDPKEGAVIALCPGETKLVRFNFVNESSGEQTYVLDEDRSLDTKWITLVQDQVNLTRNGQGEVSLRLSPPINADPGEYPFTVTVGLQGGTLTSLPLYLSVLATPAVRLTTKTRTVSIGVFSSTADFPLTVESAGNAETAFRLSIQPTGTTADNGPKVIHESGAWRYLFERELDSLRSPSALRSPPPVPVRLRLQRRGVWWLGFRESHQVHVVAVPVTETNNNGKTGNTLDLTAVRWRPWPLPGFVLAPILAVLLMLLAVGPSSLSVSNAYSADNNRAFVLGEAQGQIPGRTQDLRAALTWQQPFYALMNLDATSGPTTMEHRFVHGVFTDTVPMPSSEYYSSLTYEVRPLMRSGGAITTVYFIPARTDSKLLISDDSGPLHATQDQFPIAGETTPVTRSTVTLAVPPTGAAHLNLKNLTSAYAGYRIAVFFARVPSQFIVSNVTFDNANVVLPGQSLPPMTITRNPASPPDPGQDYELTLVTTDRAHQILRVKLKAQ